ncbi:hypothetical protein GY45DRAFT_1287702 [Cubamyces sp. BRFM 1775]|nr:hypothetical protein GY45DRAFT_1287702 [Cubamyces sp. BRFM 1775]
MWVITGPFDEEYGEVPPPDKRKLLKTGREYVVGRKDQPLTIRSKAISKAHAVLIVGECTEEQSADPAFIPTLTLHNLHDKSSRHVERPTRQNPRMRCEAMSTLVLESEDIIHLSASVPVRVHWEPVCCYNGSPRAGPSISPRDCAALGIHVVSTLHPAVTHHLTPTYALTAPIATALVSLATLVKPEWLSAILDAGNGRPSALEEAFALPPTNKYRPAFTAGLPLRLKKFDIWQPNEERVGIFRGRRFIFAGEKGAEAPTTLKELVRRAEGEYECFAIEGGSERFRQVLAKGKARESSLVLVADRPATLATIGEDGWKALVDTAKSFELKFIPPEKITEAAVYADITCIDPSAVIEEPEQSILPDVIPNTIEDEPSIPPPRSSEVMIARQEEKASASEVGDQPPRRKLPRRATSRASSRAPSPSPVNQEPVVAVEEAGAPVPEAPQPRRTLVRRAARPKTVVGIDDTTMDVDSNLASEQPAEASQTRLTESSTRHTDYIVPPTPARTSRLKRRVGTQGQSATTDVALLDTVEEPPHKRYKSLFDESDPDRVAQMNLDEYGSQHVGGGESMTQYEPSVPPFSMQSGSQACRARGTGTSGSSSIAPGIPLEALAEEEEESTLASRSDSRTQTQARGTKRKSQEADVVDDVEMADGGPPRNRPRTEDGQSGKSQAASPRSPAPTQGATHSQTQGTNKPLSKIVTRVDMSQSQVHTRAKPAKKLNSVAGGRDEGTASGEPDKDAAFLKAVASTKRGKKTEDEFDREFNNLRISKPDLEQDKAGEAWAVLDDFDDDKDVRGNFMMVVEMPVYRESGRTIGLGSDHLRRGEGRLEWQGRPDFKKFKRKTTGQRRQPVELMVEEETDLDIGSQYRKDAIDAPASPSDSQSKFESDTGKSTTQRLTTRGSKTRTPTIISDEDESALVSTSKPPSRSKSLGKRSQPSRPSSSQAKKSSAATRQRSQKQPLFMESDIEEADEDDFGTLASAPVTDLASDMDNDEMESTLRSTARGSRPPESSGTANRRLASVIMDDDSDDGATFKAFGTRARATRRR